MKRVCLALVCIGLQVTVAAADPANLENGVLIAHHPPGLQYSAGQDWCQRYFDDFAIDTCSDQHNRIDLDANQGETSVWCVLAAWDESKEWCGTEFGFGEYDPDIYLFLDHGPCFPVDGLDIPTAGWPGPNAGTALTTTTTHWSGNFVPVYWFAGYAYQEGVIPLAADPATSFGGTGNCASPPQTWAAGEFGSMGLFRDGAYACPETGLDGIGSRSEDGGDHVEGDDGLGGGGDDARRIWYVCPDGQPPEVDFPTIQQAVDAAAAGDVIELCDATFTGLQNRNIHFDQKVLTLRSRSGDPAACVIDCDGRHVIPSWPQARRGFVFERFDEVTISGVTVFDGLAYEPPPST